MNENINLYKILKEHINETFWNPLLGNIIYKGSYNRLMFFQHKDLMIDIPYDGKDMDNNIAIFPSKTQRDWNKWIEEQNSKVPKTWSELVSTNKAKSYCVHTLNNTYLSSDNSKRIIEKSALALLKIHQLIEFGYGRNITNEEWINQNTKYLINPICHKDSYEFIITKTSFFPDKFHIAFHTEKQAEEFLKYPENIQLLKDYFMIND